MNAEELFKGPRRILVIDDNPRIHEDIRKIINSTNPDGLAEDAEFVLGAQTGRHTGLNFELIIDSAYQGQEGVALVQKSITEGRPYLMAFVDMRMPPGGDGLETIQKIWAICPALQIVICTAFSDRPWHEINTKLGTSSNLLILKKPFDNMEVLQLVQTLTCKWIVTKIAEWRMGEMEIMVEERTYQMVKANEELKAESEQRTEAQLAWLHAEERFQAAFQSSPSALAILKADSLEHTDVNGSYLDLLGYGRQQIIGRTPAQLNLADAASGLAMALNELQAGRPVHNLEIEIRRSNGEKRQASISIAPMTISSQSYFLFALEDTTQIRQMEAELHQFQKIESIGQLAGGVAHDFNNILTAITLQLSLLEQNPNLDTASLESVSELQQNADRAAKLTRQLLVFSRRPVPQTKMVDLCHIVEEALKMLSRLMGPTVKIEFENQAETSTMIKADPVMVEQVLMNLVLNGRDAMSSEGMLNITLRKLKLDGDAVRHHPQARSGDFLRLSVADTGEGMDEATLKRIFEPFFTTKPEGKGTGLGLPTVYRIVKQHHGWIQVESQRGHGSAFHVYFPVPHSLSEAGEGLPLAPVATLGKAMVAPAPIMP